MPDLRPILILKAGSLDFHPPFLKLYGDTEHTFLTGCGLSSQETEVIDIQAGGALPGIGGHAAVIVSGSGAMVSDLEPWMERSADWLRGAVAADVPVLGICFGHQLLAHALGGRVGRNPQGLEGGTVQVALVSDGDPLFSAFAPGAAFQAHHYETVLEAPRGAQVLGSSALDRHQVLRHAPRAWGVQFHPELSLPMMEMLMTALENAHEQQGYDPAKIAASLRPTPEGPALLHRFVSLARG
jgi:GMP synthase (glutamine-hydrolysing)